ncbi:MAG: phytanoyl-CoA dioxygenase family protein [Congregibacter sp.]
MSGSKEHPSGRDDPRFRQVNDFRDYADVDLARTHSFTASTASSQVDQTAFSAQHEALQHDGYVIIENLMSADDLTAIRSDVADHLRYFGRNSFEGERTQRIYGLPEKFRSADRFIEHPQILAHLNRRLKQNYLLSQAQVINVMSDSPAQPLHIDDGFYPWPKPRPALSIATVFAIDDFTEDNGATVVFPGSHRWGEDRFPEDDDERVKAVMSAGSCILFLGNLWHGGGENRSGKSRLAFTAQYCEPYLRTQENYFLSVSPQTAAAVSEDMRRMLGYSIHPPFMGMSNGMHPKRELPGSG